MISKTSNGVKVRTRFAPSPTGYLHVGGLRTALYAFLFAKHNNGEFLLRIEDTDQARYVEGSIESLKNILTHMQLPWDGEVMVQSERTKIYQKGAEELVKNDKAYYCFCSTERLQELRKRQEANKLATGYDGLCRSISQEEAVMRKEKEPYVIRLKMPKSGTCDFNDLVRGNVQFAYSREEDSIILKSDGFPTYHLAHIVDDHEMKITHVIRGEEWLSSVPKHIVLWQAFGWEVPQYAHLSLIVNPDKTKLSKRQGDVSVESYLEKGYLKDALLNFILLLGWNSGTEKEIFSLDEMISEFFLEKIHKSPAVFNVEKLDWMNGYYIRSKTVAELLGLSLPYLQKANLVGENYEKKYFEGIIGLEQSRLKKLSDLPDLVSYFFHEPEFDSKILQWKKQDAKDAKMHLQNIFTILEGIDEKHFNKEHIEKEAFEYIKKNNYKNGNVLWPVRVSLSGREKSPGPFEIAQVLGKERTLQRIKKAMDIL